MGLVGPEKISVNTKKAVAVGDDILLSSEQVDTACNLTNSDQKTTLSANGNSKKAFAKEVTMRDSIIAAVKNDATVIKQLGIEFEAINTMAEQLAEVQD